MDWSGTGFGRPVVLLKVVVPSVPDLEVLGLFTLEGFMAAGGLVVVCRAAPQISLHLKVLETRRHGMAR